MNEKSIGILLAVIIVVSVFTTAIPCIASESSSTEVNDSLNYYQETFKSPISEKEYNISKILPEEAIIYKDQDGNVYRSKQEIFDKETKELQIDTNLLKLDKKLRDIIKGGDINETVSVIVVLVKQPAHDISVEVKAEYEPQFDEITEHARAIYKRIKPLLGTKEEIRSKSISEIIDTEQALLTEEEKRVLNETGIELEQKVTQMRKEILARSEPLVDEIQVPIIEKMEDNGCTIKYRGNIYNSIAADIPVSYLEELSKEPSIAMVSYDEIFNATLDVSADAIDADYWWGQGYDGGNWDAAVVDTGIDGSHPALNVYAGKVFHSSAVSDSRYDDDSTDPDDLYGHGTHCAGIVASEDSTYEGVARGMDALINAKAGWRGTDGRGHMYTSDRMEAIDWAIQHCSADADVISYSFGGSPGAHGDTGSCHYMDAIVFGLNVPIAVSAGNDGSSSTTVGDPGSAYNVITVGAIDDKNTLSRSDDSIASYSSRGPTGDGRLKPDITAPGDDIMSCNYDWEGWLGLNPDFVSKSGTSMAAPHIAGSILLILDYKGTQWDAKAIKALLLNTAEDKGSTGPDNSYGYGYVYLWDAYYYRDDVHTGSLEDKPEGDVEKFYKGPAYSRDTATMVWNRHVIYNDADYPTQYLDLSDLDLWMYNEANNNEIDSSTSTVNNVEQVESDAYYSSTIIKIEPYGTYPAGITSEGYALGTEEGFSEVDPPTLSAVLSNPSTVSAGSTFTVSVGVTNNGDINAHSVSVTLNHPSGFSIVSGSNPQTLGTINAGATKTASWTVSAPYIGASYTLSTSVTSSSYGETYTASDTNPIFVEYCDYYDGCYVYGNGCEDRDYYWDGTGCVYTYSNRNTDYYDDWVYYCSGDTVMKHRLFHDFYCEGGTCTDHTSWVDDQLVENCNDYDGWYCNGDVREYRDYYCSGGSCAYTVTSSENCNNYDGCYAYGNGCEDRDYYCSGGSCTYTYSNRHTDYYDDWVYYCSGDTVRKHRLFHDFYCDGGSCTDHTSWADDQLVENCNDHDGWVDTGDTRWIDDPANECKEKEQKEQEYRDYTCSGGSCTFSITNTQWIDTGNTRNKPDGTVCGCTANNTLKECYEGTCSDTGTCNSTICDADITCDGKKPGEICGIDLKCNSTCKCVKITEYGVDLTAIVLEKNTTPNVNATYTLIVKNTGTLVDSYTLSVDNIDNAAVASLNRSSVTNLPLGSSATVLLNVTDETPGIYNVSVTATSQGNSSVSDTIITKTTVSEIVPPRIVTYTITNRTITPPQTAEIDVAFSDEVAWIIAIESSSVIYDWSGTSTNPAPKTWDGTYEVNGTVVPVGSYIVNVTGTNTTTGLSVVNNTETITVTSSVLTSIEVAPATATLNVSKTQQFTATAYDQYGNEMPDIIFTWTGSNTTVGAINDTGYFAALAAGTTTINATNGSIVGSAYVTVNFSAGIPGDINGDSVVDYKDGPYLVKHVLGIPGYETIHANGDINCDGKVDYKDGPFLVKHVLGIPGYEYIC